MKQDYVAPDTVSVKLVSENFICDSTDISNLLGDRDDYGLPEIIVW